VEVWRRVMGVRARVERRWCATLWTRTLVDVWDLLVVWELEGAWSHSFAARTRDKMHYKH